MYKLFMHGALVFSLISLHGCSRIDTALTEPADAFLTAIVSGDTAHAHRYLSRSLKSRTSLDALAKFMRHTGLDKAGNRDWNQLSIDGDTAVLNGEIAIDGESKTLPLRVALVKEDILWKVDGLARGVRIGGEDGERVLYAPAEAEGSAMARQTTARFADAVARNDLSGYYSTMAAAFRARFSEQQFNQAFAGFVRDKVNLAAAAKRTPTFSAPPTLEDGGELVIHGAFPTQPSQVAFEYRYINENGRWINSGVTLNLIPRG